MAVIRTHFHGSLVPVVGAYAVLAEVSQIPEPVGAPLLQGVLVLAAHAASYQYFRMGNKNDIQTKPVAGIAMMGGGKDLDDAFRWLCQKGNGGDFLILRASGDDDYNSYVNELCKLNSVATLILPDRAAAEDPAVADIMKKAEVIFISGGDQAHYIRARARLHAHTEGLFCWVALLFALVLWLFRKLRLAARSVQ